MSDIAEEVAERGLPTSSDADSSDSVESSTNPDMITRLYNDNNDLWKRVNEYSREIQRLEWENSQLVCELDEETSLRRSLSSDKNNLVVKMSVMKTKTFLILVSCYVVTIVSLVANSSQIKEFWQSR
jgi:predicted RNase H-like nuclease (RuvC/YqgF family)